MATAAANAGNGLTLAEALSLAESRSALLTGSDYAAQASREMAVAAAQLPDPVATMGISNLPINGEDAWSLTRDFMTMASVGVMQEFTGKDKREARAERYRREADKAVAERAAGAASLQRDTAVAWLDRYYAEAMSTVVAEQSLQARTEVEGAESAYRAGTRQPRGPAGRPQRAGHARRPRRRVRAQGARGAHRTGALGRRARRPPLAGRPPIDTLAFDARALDAELLHHPELAVLTRQEDLAAAEVRVAQANRRRTGASR